MKTKCIAVFKNEGGHDFEKKEAIKFLTVGNRYLITDARVDRYASEVKVRGRWYNSVQFTITVDRIMKYFPNAFPCTYPAAVSSSQSRGPGLR